MSESKSTNNFVAIPRTRKRKKNPTVDIADCGFCERMILAQREPNGKYVLIGGKPMCPVCRVTKRGRMKEQILSQKDRALKDFHAGKDYKRQLENDRVGRLAAESGHKYLKNLKD